MRLLVGIGMLVLILTRVDLRSATVRPTPVLLLAIAVSAGLLVLSQAVAALRWKHVLGDALLPWSYLLRLYMIGSFFSLFLPTSVGGDAVRAMAAARASVRAGWGAVSVLIDRGFGVMATLAIAALGVLLAPQSVTLLGASGWGAERTIALGVALAVGVLLAGFLSRTLRIRALWHGSAASLGDLARSPGRLSRVSALALASQLLIVLLWYTLAWGMNLPLPPSTFLWAVPLVSLGALLPITFAGLGLREGAWLVLLAGSGIPSADIVAFSLLYFLCSLLVAIGGGVLFVRSGLTVIPPHEA